VRTCAVATPVVARQQRGPSDLSETASDAMKERGLLPLPAAPPSGMLGSIQSAALEGEEAPKGKRMQENSLWVSICTVAGR
jgi:hypothetical protein